MLFFGDKPQPKLVFNNLGGLFAAEVESLHISLQLYDNKDVANAG